MNTAEVILVNERDEEVGRQEKLKAHLNGELHRAFSVFIFNSKGEMLLQQRALHKYHSGGLWTNACCSHPSPGETTDKAAERRLNEEMGFTVPVNKQFDFVYKAHFDNGLTEYEFDHVYTAIYDGPVNFNTDEVMDVEYIPMEDLAQSLQSHPDKYTAWFQIAFPKILPWWSNNFNSKVA